MQLSDLTVELESTWVDGPGVGQVPPDDLDIEIVDLFNNVGTWTLKLPSEHRMAQYARDGTRIKVHIPGPKVLFSGPATEVNFEATPDDPQGTVIISGTSDSVYLGDRIILPDPWDIELTGGNQGHNIQGGSVEDIMRKFVLWNLGDWATGIRKNPLVKMGAFGAVGDTIVVSARFDNLGEMLGKLAPLANLGFRLISSDYGSPEEIIFETYVPEDKTDTIRLDAENGTLAGYKSAIAAPGVTSVFVAGQGDLEERQMLQADTPTSLADSARWDRYIERFVDQRQTDDTDEQQRAAEEVLAEEGFERVAIQAIPSDELMAFGTEWNLGDQVTVVLKDAEYSATVTGYRMKANSTDGFRMGALIGDPVAFDTAASFGKAIRDTSKRVSNLERNSESPLLPALPNPTKVSVSSGGFTSITSTSYAIVPGSTTLNLNLARDALVMVTFGVWLSISSGGTLSTIRCGVSVDGNDPPNSMGGSGDHGQVAQLSASTTANPQGAGGSGTMVYPLTAGSHSFQMKAMKTGTSATNISYGHFRVTILRWL